MASAAHSAPLKVSRGVSYTRTVLGRTNSQPRTVTTTVPQTMPTPGHGGNEPNETTHLISRHDLTSAVLPSRTSVKGLTRDSRPYVRWPVTVVWTTWEVLASNYANVLLVFVPLGIIAGAAGWDPVTVFILNFLAIVPLAGLLAFATEELAAKLGQTIGGLLNATFGNAVELIVSIIALREGQIRIVQSSMLGSILSNMLLVLGCCFIAGGLRGRGAMNEFNAVVASTMSSLMAVASAALVIPATLYAVTKRRSGENGGDAEGDAEKDVLILSHGTAIILLFLYLLYLFFQLYSHADIFEEGSDQNDDEEQQRNGAGGPENGTSASDSDDTAVQSDGHDADAAGSGSRQEGDTLTPIPAAVALVIITICVAICAEYLVDSIDAIVERAHISKTFIGLILLPIVGNAAEHVTAVVVSYKNKMNLALGVAIGSSMQIALFVTPFLVILGWAMGEPMTLKFEPFETVIFFLSVLIVNYLISDGKSNYLEGAMCLGMYAIIAVAFYVYPDNASSDLGSLFPSWP